MLTSRRLRLTIRELIHPFSYTIIVYEFSNGIIMIPYEDLPTEFFCSRETYVPDFIAEVRFEDTGRTENWSKADMALLVAKTIRECGKSAVPDAVFQLF